MNVYSILAFNFFTSMLGEYFCKLASNTPGNLRYWYVCVPMLAWGGSAWFWLRMYELKSMSELMAIYNPAQLLASASIAILLFGEPFTWRLGVAYVLVFVIMWLLT